MEDRLCGSLDRADFVDGIARMHIRIDQAIGTVDLEVKSLAADGKRIIVQHAGQDRPDDVLVIEAATILSFGLPRMICLATFSGEALVPVE